MRKEAMQNTIDTFRACDTTADSVNFGQFSTIDNRVTTERGALTARSDRHTRN